MWLDKKESHHARDVLRVKLGEAVEVLDGAGGKYRAVVAGFEEGRVALSLDRRAPVETAGVEITLAPAVIRPERMEWLLEKACELGVSAWRPVLTERAVVKLSRERWQAKAARWRKIARESCKQCGQPRVPQVDEPALYREALAGIGAYDLALIPTLALPAEGLYESFLAHRSAKTVLVLTGPEGDFTQKEVEQAVSAGAVPVTLGSLVLRAETAAIFALSCARFFYGSPLTGKGK